MDSIFNINEIFGSLLNVIIAKLRQHTRLRQLLLIGIIVWLTISIIIQFFFFDELRNDFKQFLLFISGFSGFTLVIVLVSYTNIKFKGSGLSVELTRFRKEREKIIEQFTAEKDNNVINTIQLSLNQITEYYTINLNQARSSYRWSITAIIVGLITLIAGAWLIFFQATPNITIATLTTISGIIIEFIGASNIYIYNKSLSQLNLYFRELINIQDTMLAIELCEKLEDSNPKKLEITEKIILNLMERSSIKPIAEIVSEPRSLKGKTKPEEKRRGKKAVSTKDAI